MDLPATSELATFLVVGNLFYKGIRNEFGLHM
jgi:hypothetical protein